VLLSEAQSCFSACGDAIMSNEMTESDSERRTMGASLREMCQTITEIVSDITEMVGHITAIAGKDRNQGILITSSRKSFSVNQQLQASVHWILRK
jgi:hypothetical protein